MTFQISKTKYFLIVLSSIYLVIHYIIHGLPNTEMFKALHSKEFNVLNILFILGEACVLLTLATYFKFYDLNTLRNTTLILFYGALMKQIFSLASEFTDLIPIIIFDVTNVILVIVEIIWIFYVLRLEKEKYAATTSLKRYAWSLIATFVLALVYAVVTILLNFPEYYKLFFVFFSFPFLFIIDFASKLRTKDKTEMAST